MFQKIGERFGSNIPCWLLWFVGFANVLLLLLMFFRFFFNRTEILSRWGLPCGTQKCLLKPFAEWRKVWWSCKLCLSILSENKTTKVSLADFIDVIGIMFKMSVWLKEYVTVVGIERLQVLRVMVEFFNVGLIDCWLLLVRVGIELRSFGLGYKI